MKYRYILLLLVFLSAISCNEYDDVPEYTYEGFRLIFLNESEIEYSKGELIIGALNVDNQFIATDSLEFGKIKLEFLSYYPHSYSRDGNRWKPDLSKIKSIPSDSCYFKIRLSNGREEFIKKSSTSAVNMALKIPDYENFRNDFGVLGILIREDIIFGGAQDVYIN